MVGGIGGAWEFGGGTGREGGVVVRWAGTRVQEDNGLWQPKGVWDFDGHDGGGMPQRLVGRSGGLRR